LVDRPTHHIVRNKILAENTEITFLKTYKDFIFNFNMLDANIAYCLRTCNRQSQDNSFEKWFKMTFDKKLKKLLNIAKGKIPQKEFNEFSNRMEKCRKWRNLVVHASWEWKGSFDSPIYYCAREPFNQEGDLSVQEFQDKLFFLDKTAKLFSELRPQLQYGEENISQ
jgi:hypothetical protein